MLEALIALAIAAILSVAATRGLSTTRLNASRLREQLTIDAVADNLINRSAERKLEDGQDSGHIGNLGWRLDVAPIAANARVLYSKADKQNETKGSQGDAMRNAPDAALVTHTLSSPPAEQAGAGVPKKPATIWQAYRVAVVVVAPSGHRLEVDTLRIGPLDAPKEARSP
jgi:hypothetical protein